jgi:hypothetical protein
MSSIVGVSSATSPYAPYEALNAPTNLTQIHQANLRDRMIVNPPASPSIPDFGVDKSLAAHNNGASSGSLLDVLA